MEQILMLMLNIYSFQILSPIFFQTDAQTAFSLEVVDQKNFTLQFRRLKGGKGSNLVGRLILV